jgi:hypothetical protein
MILSRPEFADYFNSLKLGLGNPDSPLWEPEDQIDSQWFVCVKPLDVTRYKWSYWDWCNAHLNGRVRCYSSDSDNGKEWWGFTDKQDIVLWTLKWT